MLAKLCNVPNITLAGMLAEGGANSGTADLRAAAAVAGDFSVNSAWAVGGYPDKSIVLSTGGLTGNPNEVGAFTGGGRGNKAVLGLFGFNGRKLSTLKDLSYTWTLVTGPGGPFYNPPGGPTVNTPYANFLVDFNPSGPSDIRILVVLDDSLNPAITNSIGTYTNPPPPAGGSNVLTYGWSSSQNVLIVNAPPNPVPGGVAPAVSVGANWPENAYSFAALVAANPNAVLVDIFPNDGGMRAGTVLPAIVINSGDSGNLTRGGYRLSNLTINGKNLLA